MYFFAGKIFAQIKAQLNRVFMCKGEAIDVQVAGFVYRVKRSIFWLQLTLSPSAARAACKLFMNIETLLI